MPTLILTPRYTPDSVELWRAAGHLGWDVERIQHWIVTPEMKQVKDPILYCEGLFAETFAQEFGFHFTEPPEDWLAKLPEKYLQRKVSYISIGEVKAGPLPIFVKPPNDKSFTARVLEKFEELPVWFPDEFMVLASEPVKFVKEFRCWIDKRQVKTHSVYLRDGFLQRYNGFATTEQEDQDMLEFAETVISDPEVFLPNQVVLDVGILDNGRWCVIELNACWGSGIYGCDPVKVLGVLKNYMDEVKQTGV